MGSPSIVFNASHYKTAREMAGRGQSREMIAEALGLSRAAFYQRIKTDKTLKLSLSNGDAQDIGECFGVLREKAIAGSYQHMDRYLFMRHGLRSGGDGVSSTGAVVINVTVPFDTGRNGWEKVVNDTLPDTLLIDCD